jgi:magnesium-transporting ATPase (P-type)
MLNISGAIERYVPELLLTLMWFFLFVVLLRFRRSRDSLRPSVLRKQVDDYQSRQRWMMLMFVVLVFVMCLSAIPSPIWGAGGNTFSNWFHALALPFVVTLCTLFVSIGPGFLSKRYRPAIDDELSRSLRAKAAKLGYTLAMILLAGGYVVAAARPVWSLTVFPLLLFAGFAIPALYLTWLEWRANQSG